MSKYKSVLTDKKGPDGKRIVDWQPLPTKDEQNVNQVKEWQSKAAELDRMKARKGSA